MNRTLSLILVFLLGCSDASLTERRSTSALTFHNCDLVLHISSSTDGIRHPISLDPQKDVGSISWGLILGDEFGTDRQFKFSFAPVGSVSLHDHGGDLINGTVFAMNVVVWDKDRTEVLQEGMHFCMFRGESVVLYNSFGVKATLQPNLKRG